MFSTLATRKAKNRNNSIFSETQLFLIAHLYTAVDNDQLDILIANRYFVCEVSWSILEKEAFGNCA